MANPTNPQKGCITVNSIPPGAAIQLDSKETGLHTPATIIDIEPGTYTLGLSLPDATPVFKKVNVTAGSVTSVDLTIMTKEMRNMINWVGIYTILCIVFLIGIAILTRLDIFISPPDDLMRIIIYVACSGGIGGLTFSIYGYIYHISVGDFNPNYAWWYIFRPMSGIIYGTFVFLLVAGGFMTLSGTSAPVSENLFTTKTVMFYCALSFLAGYSEKPVSLQLKALAEAIFKNDAEEKLKNPEK